MEKRDYPGKGRLARSYVGSPKPWGSRTSGPQAGTQALQVTRKSSLLNSIRILENFCTVISSELLFRLLEREKLTQRL